MDHKLKAITTLNFNDAIIWVSIIILINLSILAFTKQRNNAIQIAIKSFFNVNFFRQSLREETNSTLFYGRLLLLNAVLVLSITIYYFISSLIKLDTPSTIILLIIAIGVVTWYYINYLLKFIVARVSGLKIIENISIRFHQYHFQVLGIVVLPGTLGMYFFPIHFYGIQLRDIAEYYTISIIIILLLNKLLQSLLQSFEIKISWFYIFLYICTLEILPLCIGFQLLVSATYT